MAESQFTTIIALKNSGYVVAFIAGSNYLGFNPEALAILGLLMCIDIVTAVFRVFLNEGGEHLTSRILQRGVVTKLLTWAALISVALTGKLAGFDVDHSVTGFVLVIALGECYSILGNIQSALTGKKKVEFDALAYLLSKVRQMLEKLIN